MQPAKEEMLQNKDQPLDNESNAVLTNILANKLDNSQALIKSTAMTSSVASIMDDSTPSDSGVQLLDSMSSDMNESFMSNFGSDFDTANNTALTASTSATATITESSTTDVKQISDQVVLVNTVLPDVVMATATEIINKEHPINVDEIALTKSDIDNSNVDTSYVMDVRPDPDDIPDEMKTSTCSTFDTEGIVFRRKVKKTRTNSTSSSGGTKKRVSFHEDILKNTRTDNIHIEHGFVTYNGYTKKYPHSVSRYSWCSEGDNFNRNKPYYRNACSDVLDYGKTDLYEDNDSAFIAYDNSGVFEYSPAPQVDTALKVDGDINENQQFYQCTCSGSNSSLDSGDSSNGNEKPIDNEQKRTSYSQAKSKSCDCIGNKSNNNNEMSLMTDNCYFSEPCFGSMDESYEMISPKSVWRKEMKPKSSCLKKTRRETGVIPEYDLSTKVKKFNVHQDMNNLFGSLKNIFSMPLPERGVPEGCEDLQTVYECVPEMDNGSPIKMKTNTNTDDNNTVLKTSIEDPMKRKMEMSLDTTPIMEAPKPFGNDSDEKEEATEIVGRTRVTPTPNSFRNKFIVNCESTVFEHTGVFFENKDNETAQHNSLTTSPFLPATPQQMSTTKTSSLFSAAPFKQKLSNIFKSFRDSPSPSPVNNAQQQVDQQQQQFTAVLQQQLKKHEELQQIQQLQQQLKEKQKQQQQKYQQYFNVSPMAEKNQGKFVNDTDSMGTMSMTSSMISTCSDKNSMVSSCTMSTSTNTFSGHEQFDKTLLKATLPTPQTEMGSPNGKTKHLASPCRRKSQTSKFDRSKLSPDLFCSLKEPVNPMVLLNEEFDDLLTITTTESEFNESEIEIVDYSQASGLTTETRAPSRANEPRAETSNHFLRPPSSKSSLINRFLRNVTQKKINDATIKKNNILSAKYRVEPKLFSNLYVKLTKPINTDIMADFNAQIAAEIESNSNCSSPVKMKKEETIKADEQFGIGVGEVPVDIFDRDYLHILRDDKEILMKVSV